MLNQCYSLRGLEVVSAVNICSTVSDLFYCAFFALGTTVSIMIGQLLGAGEPEKAIDYDRKLIVFSVLICVVLGCIMALCAPLIPELYNTSSIVKDLASSLLLVNAVLMPANAFTNCCYFTLRSGGKTLITFLFDSAFVWLINLPAAFSLTHFTALPILIVYLSVSSLELLKCLSGYILVRSHRWVNNLTS